jgi:hypothetical protein
VCRHHPNSDDPAKAVLKHPIAAIGSSGVHARAPLRWNLFDQPYPNPLFRRSRRRLPVVAAARPGEGWDGAAVRGVRLHRSRITGADLSGMRVGSL